MIHCYNLSSIKHCIMSYVALIFLLSLSSSLHACSARLLFSIDNQTGHSAYHDATVVEKEKYQRSDETSKLSNLKAAISMPSHELKSNNNGRISDFRTNYSKLRTLVPPIKKQDQPATNIIRATSGSIMGNRFTKSFSHTELQQSTETNKGQKGQSMRSMLGVGSIPQANEETVDTKESDTRVDDIVMMDYAQPHRKPPIHNEKP